MMRKVYKIFILLALVFGAAMHVQADSKRYKKALFSFQDDLAESVISPHHILAVRGLIISSSCADNAVVSFYFAPPFLLQFLLLLFLLQSPYCLCITTNASVSMSR